MTSKVAEAHRPTNAGDHATAVGDVPDGRLPARRPASVQGGEPMQILRASAIVLPFIGLALLVGLLSALLTPR
jgi:hypothetical protein